MQKQIVVNVKDMLDHMDNNHLVIGSIINGQVTYKDSIVIRRV